MSANPKPNSEQQYCLTFDGVLKELGEAIPALQGAKFIYEEYWNKDFRKWAKASTGKKMPDDYLTSVNGVLAKYNGRELVDNFTYGDLWEAIEGVVRSHNNQASRLDMQLQSARDLNHPLFLKYPIDKVAAQFSLVLKTDSDDFNQAIINPNLTFDQVEAVAQSSLLPKLDLACGAAKGTALEVWNSLKTSLPADEPAQSPERSDFADFFQKFSLAYAVKTATAIDLGNTFWSLYKKRVYRDSLQLQLNEPFENRWEEVERQFLPEVDTVYEATPGTAVKLWNEYLLNYPPTEAQSVAPEFLGDLQELLQVALILQIQGKLPSAKLEIVTPAPLDTGDSVPGGVERVNPADEKPTLIGVFLNWCKGIIKEYFGR